MIREKSENSIGNYAPDFELPGIDDQVHHLASYLEKNRAVAVIFMCNHCPYVGLYVERMKQIQSEFQAQGFTIIGINANDPVQYPEDSFENMKTFAQQKQLNFPYLWDSNQDVAHSFGAQKTPEAFVLDNTGIFHYRGAIDDNAREPEAVKVPYLREALASLLKGEAVTVASIEAVGCSLKWAK